MAMFSEMWARLATRRLHTFTKSCDSALQESFSNLHTFKANLKVTHHSFLLNHFHKKHLDISSKCLFQDWIYNTSLNTCRLSICRFIPWVAILWHLISHCDTSAIHTICLALITRKNQLRQFATFNTNSWLSQTHLILIFNN